jgi:surfeit locus 1 family protein
MQIIAFNRCWVIRLHWLLITILSASFLFGLAVWQLHRAAEKAKLLQRLEQIQVDGFIGVEKILSMPPAMADGLNVKAKAQRLSPTMWLLDNQVVKGHVGYDVIVPVRFTGTTRLVLVNLGWVAAPISREQLPAIEIPAEFEVEGILRTHFGGIRLGQNVENKGQWPMRIQQLDLGALATLLKQPLYAGIIYQLQNSPYTAHYQAVVMPPERHKAYALQWFLLAIAVMAVALAASVKKVASE